MSSLILTEIIKASPSKLIDLYEADFSSIVDGGPTLRFFSDTNELGNEIVFNTLTYDSIPCEVTGFEWNGSGQLPNPKLKISNIDGALVTLNLLYQDLVGLKITRIRTMVKFLDAVNFEDGNTEADPTAQFPKEIYYIDRKAVQNPMYGEYELVSALDISSVSLPRRIIMQNLCPWKYKDSTTCGYSYGVDPIYYKANGDVTLIPEEDKCGKKLSDCKLRFNQVLGGVLNFGGFPGAGVFK